MTRSTDETNRLGVLAVGTIFTKLGWAFREQPTSDFGMDAQAEKLGEDGLGTGRLVALQIKSGASWFRARGGDYVYYGEERHLDYWTNHSLPVLIVIHDPDRELTLWQKIDRSLANEGKDGRWSITIPSGNVLDEAHERYILAGIAPDEASVRRYKLALDIPLMERIAEEDFAYLRLEEWVNKTLNFRRSELVLGDDPEAGPDFDLDTWMPARDRVVFMAEMFPWLDYKLHEYSDDGGAGEVAVHVLEVQLSAIGKAALLLEEFYRDGAPENEDDGGGTVSQEWLASIDDIHDDD